MEKTASFGRRLIAGLIDIFLLLFLELFLFWAVVFATTVVDLLDALLRLVIVGFLLLPLTWPFFNSFLICQLGGTLGKLFTGSKIVDSQGEKISFWRAFFRNYLGYMVSGMFFGAGFIWIAKDKKRRGWHDMMADTLVVVTSQLGAVTGILAFLILLFGIIFVGIRSYQLILANLPFYQSIVQEIVGGIR